jgi:hypothetical protein
MEHFTRVIRELFFGCMVRRYQSTIPDYPVLEIRLTRQPIKHNINAYEKRPIFISFLFQTLSHTLVNNFSDYLIPDMDSCIGRCFENIIRDNFNFKQCDCYKGCGNTCCSDFQEICLYETGNITVTQTKSSSTLSIFSEDMYV